MKPLVHIAIPLMNAKGRIVGHKHIHRREVLQRCRHFVMIKKMVAAGLVTPASREAAKAETFHSFHCEMEVFTSSGKGPAGSLFPRTARVLSGL